MTEGETEQQELTITRFGENLVMVLPAGTLILSK